MNANPGATTETEMWKRAVETCQPLTIRYPGGELIYQGESYAAGVYLISSGLVSEGCSPQHTSAEESLAEILGPGELIGIEVLCESLGNLHMASARAIIETELLFFERSRFAALIDKETKLKDYCLTRLTQRLYSLKRVASCSGSSVSFRMAQILAECAGKTGYDGSETQRRLPYRQMRAALSRLMGISALRVDRVMARLPEASIDNETILVSLDALRHRLSSTGAEDKKD